MAAEWHYEQYVVIRTQMAVVAESEDTAAQLEAIAESSSRRAAQLEAAATSSSRRRGYEGQGCSRG